MNKITLFLSIVIGFSMVSCKTEKTNITETETQKTENRIVSLSGAITETIAALGHGDEIVGRDVTSTFPENLSATDLGHVRSMTIEPIMSVNPNLILASEKDINPDLMAKMKESGVKMEMISQEYSVEGAQSLVKEVAGIIGAEDYKRLTDKIDSDIAQLQPIEKKPKVLFIYARGAGNLMVAGSGTPMEALIKIAGGENAVSEFSDFKDLTPESLIQGNPDVILMFDSGIQSLGGVEGVLKVPGVEQTNAGKNKKIITMDGGLMTSFGPRTGEAALELNKKLIEAAK